MCIIWIIINIITRLIYDEKYIFKSNKDVSIHASNKICTKYDDIHLYWE